MHKLIFFVVLSSLFAVASCSNTNTNNHPPQNNGLRDAFSESTPAIVHHVDWGEWEIVEIGGAQYAFQEVSSFLTLKGYRGGRVFKTFPPVQLKEYGFTSIMLPDHEAYYEFVGITKRDFILQMLTSSH
jgi:hypothetical protein